MFRAIGVSMATEALDLYVNRFHLNRMTQRNASLQGR
jgi:hypothetical protein